MLRDILNLVLILSPPLDSSPLADLIALAVTAFLLLRCFVPNLVPLVPFDSLRLELAPF